MTMTAEVADSFAGARQLHTTALERLAVGDMRDAAEKAWCATKRATDALILAKTGISTDRTPETSTELRKLAASDAGVQPLVSRYYSRQGILHGDCFSLGLCEPSIDTERRIRETGDYIADAERLAAA